MSTLIRFKDVNDSIPSSKENTDDPRCDWAIKFRKISALDIPNQPLIRNKDLSDCVYDTTEHL